MKININIPDGASGEYKVESFEISEQDAEIASLRALFHGGRGNIKPGIYKKLTKNGVIIMSNSPDEIRDFSYFVHIAEGNILINGLGLGVLVQALLNKPEVVKLTIIEISKDVINLVAPTFLKDKRVNIINDDAFNYNPPKDEYYNYVWHDIWTNISKDNLSEMTKLHRKYAKKTNFQDSWCKELCKQSI